MFGETAGQMIRAMVPRSAYLRMARLYRASDSALRMGLWEYARLARFASQDARGAPRGFRVPGLTQRVLVRPGTSDWIVLEDVLLRRSYACVPDWIDVRYVLDAGANVGYASLFFLSRYPLARLTAVEPDADNLALAERNLQTFADRVRCVHGAVWPEGARLRVVSSDRADGFQVLPTREGEAGTCVGMNPLTILEESGSERISVFKCDIEGGEKALFEESPDAWIDRTDVLLIETHGSAAREAVYRALGRHPFESRVFRETHVFVRRGGGAG